MNTSINREDFIEKGNASKDAKTFRQCRIMSLPSKQYKQGKIFMIIFVEKHGITFI